MLWKTADLTICRDRSSQLASPRGDDLPGYSDVLQGQSNGAFAGTLQRAEMALKESVMRAETNRQAAADPRLRESALAAHYTPPPSSNLITHLPSYSSNSTPMPLFNSSAPPTASPQVAGAWFQHGNLETAGMRRRKPMLACLWIGVGDVRGNVYSRVRGVLCASARGASCLCL